MQIGIVLCHTLKTGQWKHSAHWHIILAKLFTNLIFVEIRVKILPVAECACLLYLNKGNCNNKFCSKNTFPFNPSRRSAENGIKNRQIAA